MNISYIQSAATAELAVYYGQIVATLEMTNLYGKSVIQINHLDRPKSVNNPEFKFPLPDSLITYWKDVTCAKSFLSAMWDDV